ncbi:hypothetical protein [Gluconobacter cerinus]|uniref:Uncharacterized protein n=1 Tax=Gluconobacter cerinus TaxID=38307 RepID=A0AAV5NC92_9PROT|nr:hypothetical protein [Gluconobacter cerinus]GBR03260.1 hypothetical protein AA0229_1901 [Gluconobacter cerinus NRIC 0229]GLQ61584.1 hypothetical protein GCM10007867_04290 [Gluconobacter cerinus]
MKANAVGKVRHKTATMLSKAFERAGVSVLPFDGSNLVPATGYWKKADCFRWETVGLKAVNPASGNAMGLSVGSWDTMTDILKAGRLDLTQERLGGWEAHARAGDPA